MANTQNLDLVKPLGTDYALVSVLNSNSDKIDAYAGAVNASLDGLRDGLGVLADGNTHAAITSGQFVYVKNHQTLPQGLYQATTNIAANGTLSTSNLAADPKGGLNTLSEQIGNKAKKSYTLLGTLTNTTDTLTLPSDVNEALFQSIGKESSEFFAPFLYTGNVGHYINIAGTETTLYVSNRTVRILRSTADSPVVNIYYR